MEQPEETINDPVQEIEQLKTANEKMVEEFNSQRAKMKELFLQKEAELLKKTDENNKLLEEIMKVKNELDDVKSQLVVDGFKSSDFENEKRKAEEEIASLQRLIHETVEESSSTRNLYDQELLKLQNYIKYLQQKIEQLTHEKTQQQQASSQEHTLAPSVMINAITKGIAKKLDAFGGSQEDKSTDKLQDDAELLKSLVEPLEDQIKALKEKLRAADDQLQKCSECRTTADNVQNTTATNTSFEGVKSECDMCSNYEAQLVNEQQTVSELRQKVGAAEKAAERHKEELLKEIGFRKEMEEKWNEKREELKQQLDELSHTTYCTEQNFLELKHDFQQSLKDSRMEMTKLTAERERIYHELSKLQSENDTLVAKYSIHSQELDSEFIDLPNDVDELHVLLLKYKQDLVNEKVGKETAVERVKNLESEKVLLNSHLSHMEEEKRRLQDRSMKLEREKEQFLIQTAAMANNEEQIAQLTAAVEKLKSQNQELRNRVHSLQEDLEAGETVQQDFVKLSQSLQIQLEKIREADHQVRWQHDEDVDQCPKCRVTFSNPRKKQHCRHCGQIFCITCVNMVVNSGPNMRPSRVCDVCHTLLVKSSAPYFSKEPPNNT